MSAYVSLVVFPIRGQAHFKFVKFGLGAGYSYFVTTNHSKSL